MTDPLFVNQRLDENIERGAKGGPSFLTTVLALASGFEKRNQEWSLQRLKWDIGYGVQSKTDYEDVIAQFYVCAGRAHGFRFKDWQDFEIGRVAPTAIGTGNGVLTAFQAVRVYSIANGTYTFARKITRLVQGTTPALAVYDNGVLKTEGVDFTVNYDTGLITFTAPLANAHIATMYGQFDVPVRFDNDFLSTEVTWSDAMALPSIQIIELKE